MPQGKFYAHQAVDRDLVHCPPPQRLSAAPAAAAPAVASRTLASRTDVVVCEAPRKLPGGAPPPPTTHTENNNPFAPRKVAEVVTVDPSGAVQHLACSGVQRTAREAQARYEATVSAYERSKAISRGLQRQMRRRRDDDDGDATTATTTGAAAASSTPVGALDDLPEPPRVVVEEDEAAAGEDDEAAPHCAENPHEVAYKRSKALSRQLMDRFGAAPPSTEGRRAAAGEAPEDEDEDEDEDEAATPEADRFPPPAPPLNDGAPFCGVPHTVDVLSETVVAAIGPLVGCATAADLDLTVTRTDLTLTGPALIRALTISLPQPVDETRPIEAKFHKATATLRVTMLRIIMQG